MLLVVDNGSVYTDRLAGVLDRAGVRHVRQTPLQVADSIDNGGGHNSGSSSSNDNDSGYSNSGGGRDGYDDIICRYDGGIILSGRRSNDRQTNAVNSGLVGAAIRNDGAKLLGICYGAEILALATGGTIRKSGGGDSGRSHPQSLGAGAAGDAAAHDAGAAATATATTTTTTATGSTAQLQKGMETVRVTGDSQIAGAGSVLRVFESHSYEISRMAPPLAGLGGSAHCRYEIIQYAKRPIFGTQFHPEMSPDGHVLIERFCQIQ